MKISFVALLLTSANAFTVPQKAARSASLLFSSAPSDVDDSTLEDEEAAAAAPVIIDMDTAKADLLRVAQSLHSQHGLLLVEKAAKSELQTAVEALEASAASKDPLWSPMGWPDCLDVYKGDWTLLCSTVSNRDGYDREQLEGNLPSFVVDPLARIRGTILDVSNKYLAVQQKIKSTKDDGVIDRIDHTLELEPPAQLRDVLENLPEQLQTLNINPLAVSKSKLVLIHKADIEDGPSSAATSISLQSIVLNVAGTSRVLDPDGKDLAGINLPSLGDFLNTASFNTTYCDGDLRISRGKLLGQEEFLRVFVRTEPPTTKVDIESELSEEEEIVDIEAGLADVDVEGIVSPSAAVSEDEDEESSTEDESDSTDDMTP
mmetsp:Transcript_4251/g.8914  ORF Transcript_4251/g.8914 Transcript_4251/m.8914 type:complete len:375 (-) Transcript_4251:462-1586(-)